MKITFYIETSVEFQKPWFRSFPVYSVFEKIARSIKKNNSQAEFSLILGLGAYQAVLERGNTLSVFDKVFLIDSSRTKESFIKLKSEVDFAFWADQSDSLIIWESETEEIEQLFKKAKKIYLSPGVFSRPPYPYHITVDKSGFFGKSKIPLPINIKTIPELDVLMKAQQESAKITYDFSIPEQVKVEKEGYEKVFLLPLQVSDYFATSSSLFDGGQWGFLNYVLQRVPAAWGIIVTHYISPGLSEETVRLENINYLKLKYKNLIYHPHIDKIDSSSQTLMHFTDGVISFSSSVGLQAKAFGKTLISTGETHLSDFSDYIIGSDGILPNRSKIANAQEVIRALHGEYFIPLEALCSDERYMQYFIEAFVKNTNSALDKITRERISKQYLEKIEEQTAAHQVTQNASTKGWLSDYAKIIIDRILDKNTKVISFDVFDTIIQREVLTPQAVFDLVDREFRVTSSAPETYSLNRKITQLGFNSYRELRVHAEKTARERVRTLFGYEDCNFNEIRDILEDLLEDSQLATKLCEIEIDVEYKTLRVRHHGKLIYEVAKSTGKPVVFCSDMYHSADLIAEFLKRNDVYSEERIYVSSAERKRKHTSTIFPLISRDHSCSLSEIYHVGDSEHGDYLGAKRVGVRASLVPSAPEGWKKTFGNVYQRNAGANLTEELIFGAQSCYIFDSPYFMDSASLTRGCVKNFGYAIAAPFLLGLVNWLIDKAHADGITDLYLFSRDGYVIKRVLDKLKSRLRFKYHYVSVSRRTVMLAALETDGDILELARARFKNSSLKNFLVTRFGIDISTFDSSALQYMLDQSEFKSELDELNTDRDFKKIAKLAILLKAEILASSAQVRERLKKSLLKFEMTPSEKTAVFDIGYAASLQRGLEKIYKQRFLTGYYVATFVGINKFLDEGGKAVGYIGESIDPSTSNLEFVKKVYVFETIFSHTEGSTLDYTPDGSPILISEHKYIQKNEFVSKLWRGIDDFIRLYLRYSNIIDFREFSWEKALRPFDHLVQKMNAYDLSIFSGIVFENKFSGDVLLPILDVKQKSSNVFWKSAQTTIAKSQESLAKYHDFISSSTGYKEVTQMLYESYLIKKLQNEIDGSAKKISKLTCDINTAQRQFDLKYEAVVRILDESKISAEQRASIIDIIKDSESFDFSEMIKLDPALWFDESEYLQANPDVLISVTNGELKSGYNHYITFGARENRPLRKV